MGKPELGQGSPADEEARAVRFSGSWTASSQESGRCGLQFVPPEMIVPAGMIVLSLVVAGMVAVVAQSARRPSTGD